MKAAHRPVAESPFEVTSLSKGYADRGLRVDLGTNEIRIFPVTRQMKDLWVGGKGLDLWLMFLEVTAATRWDSPENPICFSPGPLAGTTSFPGAGKTLVTSLSPMTGSVIDCNVGGFFGPLFKFCGFDALVLVGKAPEESIVVIDAARGRITIERSPLESGDAHLLAEELTEMYADDELDKKHVSVVCAGRGAEHTRMGVLNFSFYDWRKKTARIKQAGRGGIGRVLRDKRVKAVVVKNRGINPAWSIAESPVARCVTPKISSAVRDADAAGATREVIAKWESDPEQVIGMLREVQEHFGHLPRAALDEITRATCVPTGYLYHMATFLGGLRLEPLGSTVVQVCTGTTCQALGASRILAACERALGVRSGGTTPDGRVSLLAGESCPTGCASLPAGGPSGNGCATLSSGGPCLGACQAAPLLRIGESHYGHVRPEDVAALLERHGVLRAASAAPAASGAPAAAKPSAPLSARPLSADELSMIEAERAAFASRSRALLAICTGRRTPAGAEAKPAEAAAPGSPAAAPATLITGCVARPGPIPDRAGATLRALIDAAGGLRDGRSFRGAQAGGPSGVFLGPGDLERPLDLSALKPTGAMTGPNRLIILDDSVCMVDLLHRHAAMLLAQSCGKCTPCREGLFQITRTLGRLSTGAGRREDLDFILDLCATMEEVSFCQFGVWAQNPIRSALDVFRRDFEDHAGGRCRAGVCPECRG